MVRAVALDLMDTVVHDPFREALRAGIRAPLDELFARRDPDLYPALERGEIDEEDYWGRIRALGIEVDPGRFHAVRRAGTTWLPGMGELLDELGGRVLRVTASNYPIWVEELADEVLGDRFDRVLASCHLGARKPDPDFFERLLDALGLPGAEVAFVDDRERNVASARGMGLAVHRYEGVAGVRRFLRGLGVPVAPPGDLDPRTQR